MDLSPAENLKLALRKSMDMSGDVRKHHDPEEDKRISEYQEEPLELETQRE